MLPKDITPMLKPSQSKTERLPTALRICQNASFLQELGFGHHCITRCRAAIFMRLINLTESFTMMWQRKPMFQHPYFLAHTQTPGIFLALARLFTWSHSKLLQTKPWCINTQRVISYPLLGQFFIVSASWTGLPSNWPGTKVTTESVAQRPTQGCFLPLL